MKSVLIKLKKSITNNIVLKIAAVFIAAVVWLAVVNLSDPNKTVTIYNIPISVENEEAITGQNKVYEINDKMLVNVTITGKRSIIQDLNSDDFEATVSLDEISVANSVQVYVTTKNKRIENKITISNQSVTAVMVDVEDVVEKKYDVKVETTGNPAVGYSVGQISYSNYTVKVNAPESIQNRIDSAKVVVDVDGATTDISDKYAVKLYDKSGKIIKGSKIKKSLSKMKVQIEILKGKEIPVVVENTNDPADGYEITGVENKPGSVVVVGDKSTINGLSEIKIPAKDVVVTGKTEDVKLTVDIRDYLPNGVRLLDEENSYVTITVKIEQYQVKDIDINASSIDMKRLSGKLDAQFKDDSITISLTGKSSDLEKISADDIKASVDLKGLKAGTEDIKVKISVPKGIKVVGETTIGIKLSKK